MSNASCEHHKNKLLQVRTPSLRSLVEPGKKGQYYLIVLQTFSRQIREQTLSVWRVPLLRREAKHLIWLSSASVSIPLKSFPDPGVIIFFSCSTQLSMKFVLSKLLKLPTIAISFLLNKAEHENFSASKHELLLAFSYLLAEKISCSTVSAELSMKKMFYHLGGSWWKCTNMHFIELLYISMYKIQMGHVARKRLFGLSTESVLQCVCPAH